MNRRGMDISSATINTHDAWSCVSAEDFQIYQLQGKEM